MSIATLTPVIPAAHTRCIDLPPLAAVGARAASARTAAARTARTDAGANRTAPATVTPVAATPTLPRPVHPALPIGIIRPVPAQPRTAPAPRPAPTTDPRPAGVRAVPRTTEARGFALYVGLDENKAAAAGVDLGRVVEALKRLAAELAPEAQTYASVALAPKGVGGRDVDVVRLALQEPGAVAAHHVSEDAEDEDRAAGGVVVDISRKRLLIDNEPVALTYKEFELLQYLVLREGRTIERTELISSLWSADDEHEAPNERTIDVHVRRLRGKLGRYEEIVRTVRGVGYRFDRHADVVIEQTPAPSPDLF